MRNASAGEGRQQLPAHPHGCGRRRPRGGGTVSDPEWPAPAHRSRGSCRFRTYRVPPARSLREDGHGVDYADCPRASFTPRGTALRTSSPSDRPVVDDDARHGAARAGRAPNRVHRCINGPAARRPGPRRRVGSVGGPVPRTLHVPGVGPCLRRIAGERLHASRMMLGHPLPSRSLPWHFDYLTRVEPGGPPSTSEPAVLGQWRGVPPRSAGSPAACVRSRD